ncbi:MAG: hypothetical protein K2X97_01405 [Mycobacteriaceae bacterium]|nr:hypothetical protein [Mycobacteriaceae bacterium]
MGFLIQWLVYLAAFVAGSGVAYAIATLLIKPDSATPAPHDETPESVSEPAAAEDELPVPDAVSAKESETFEQLLWPDSTAPAELAEVSAPGHEAVEPESEAEAAEHEPAGPVIEEPVAEVAEEPQPEPEPEPEVAESSEPDPELSQPQWQESASHWPGPGTAEREDAEAPTPAPELRQPQWPGPPSQWPGIGVKR